MNNLETQMMRVEIASEQLQSAPIHKTKKAAIVLGDETSQLFKLIITEINQLKGELSCKIQSN